MQLSTTFRHMDASEASRVCGREAREDPEVLPDPISAHVVFSVERGYHHIADVNITLPNGIVINGNETTEDMYSSIDLAMASIERQVRRYKDKIRDHKPHGGPSTSVREMVITAEAVEPPARSGRSPTASPPTPVPPRLRPATRSSRTRPSPPGR